MLVTDGRIMSTASSSEILRQHVEDQADRRLFCILQRLREGAVGVPVTGETTGVWTVKNCSCLVTLNEAFCSFIAFVVGLRDHLHVTSTVSLGVQHGLQREIADAKVEGGGAAGHGR